MNRFSTQNIHLQQKISHTEKRFVLCSVPDKSRLFPSQTCHAIAFGNGGTPTLFKKSGIFC